MSDDRKLHIKTIETHLRRLGLTESQILLHLAPLRAKEGKPLPIRRKVRQANQVITYFMRPSRKPVVVS
jgi:hypothetical protein